jgi:hypothetical protein
VNIFRPSQSRLLRVIAYALITALISLSLPQPAQASVLRSILLFTLMLPGCYWRHQFVTSIPQERVQKANNQAEAESALEDWDDHMSRAKELADSANYQDAMVEIETAMRLVERFGIREEGATNNDTYTLLDRFPGVEKGGLLLQLLSDGGLVETRDVIISQAVAYLELDAKRREQIGALPQDRQVEIVADLLAKRGNAK